METLESLANVVYHVVLAVCCVMVTVKYFKEN